MALPTPLESTFGADPVPELVRPSVPQAGIARTATRTASETGSPGPPRAGEKRRRPADRSHQRIS
jgi:hypothetical protein